MLRRPPMACPVPPASSPGSQQRCPLGPGTRPPKNPGRQHGLTPHLTLIPFSGTLPRPPPPPLSALSALSPMSSRPPEACHFWSSSRSHLPACTWLSPLGGLASREARVAAAHHPSSRDLLTLWALPQLADVAEEGGSIECALPGERGIRPPRLGPKTWRPIKRSSKICRPTKVTGCPDHPPEADGRSSQP